MIKILFPSSGYLLELINGKSSERTAKGNIIVYNQNNEKIAGFPGSMDCVIISDKAKFSFKKFSEDGNKINLRLKNLEI